MEEIKCKQVGQILGSGFTEMTGRVYSPDGLSPSIRTFAGGNTEVKSVDDMYNSREIRVYDDCPSLRAGRQGLKVIEPICLNSKVNGKQPSLTDRVYDTKGISTCVTTSPFFMGNIAETIAYDEQNGYLRQDGCVGTLTTDGSTPKHNNRIVETRICAMRGRNPDNSSDRTAGSPTKQRFEIGSAKTSNTLTTVQKDNLVIEPVWDNDLGCFVDKNSGECLIDYNDRPPIKRVPQYRIRKLTPRETYRLMGFDNTDFDNTAYGGVSTANYRKRLNARTMTKSEWKAFYRLTRTQTMSNTQLYKQAGNSMVTAVLMAIFGELLGVEYESKIAELVEKLKDDPTHN